MKQLTLFGGPRWFLGAVVVTVSLVPFVGSCAAARTDNLVAGVTVSQPVVLDAGTVYKAGSEARIGFTLARPSSVVISIFSARPLGEGPRWYANDGTRVAQLQVPAGKAGHQEISLQLDQVKAPVAPLPGLPLSQLSVGGAEAIPGVLPGPYVVEVMAGRSYGFAPIQLRRPGAVFPGSRLLTGYISGSTRDSKGNIIAADVHSWIGRRYTPDLKADLTYPGNLGSGQSSQPVECFDVAVDQP